MTLIQIESRANIVGKRRRKLLDAFCKSKSELYKVRCDRILRRMDKEFCRLESMYRIEKKRVHDEGRSMKNLLAIDNVRLN